VIRRLAPVSVSYREIIKTTRFHRIGVEERIGNRKQIVLSLIELMNISLNSMEQKMDCNKTLYVANLMGDRGFKCYQVVDRG